MTLISLLLLAFHRPAKPPNSEQVPRYCSLIRSAGAWIQAVETLFLLVVERAVKFRERRLHGFHRSQHRIESLLHHFEASYRRERAIGRAVGFEQFDGL